MKEKFKQDFTSEPEHIDSLPMSVIRNARKAFNEVFNNFPKLNYFRRIVSNNDTIGAKKYVAFLMGMTDDVWSQTPEDDRALADVYSSPSSLRKLSRLLKLANIKGDKDCPEFVEKVRMLLGLTEPKEDLRMLAHINNCEDSLLREALGDGSLPNRSLNILKKAIKNLLSGNSCAVPNTQQAEIAS